MLGPIGKCAKALMTRAGYEISRPTEHERRLMRSFWEDWLSADPVRLGEIYRSNRETLTSVNQWIGTKDLDQSLWRYGVPETWDTARQGLGRTGLNEVEKEVTYSDLLGFIAGMIEPLVYLEIGVSVGKNFLQMIKLFPDATIVGLDVEDLNPRIAREFERVETIWQSDIEHEIGTLSGARTRIRFTQQLLHRDGGKPVLYVKGDQFSPETWSSLKGKRFNLIFSDGVHSANALRSELDHLIDNDLVDRSGKFAMYWDDLVNIEMQSAFRDNSERLASMFAGSSYGLHWIHGTYGLKRINGLFSTFR